MIVSTEFCYFFAIYPIVAYSFLAINFPLFAASKGRGSAHPSGEIYENSVSQGRISAVSPRPAMDLMIYSVACQLHPAQALTVENGYTVRQR